MAQGGDPIQEELRRSHSLSLDSTQSTKPVHDGKESSLSLQGLNTADIGKLLQ